MVINLNHWVQGYHPCLLNTKLRQVMAVCTARSPLLDEYSSQGVNFQYGEHMTTYGVDKAHCAAVGRIGDDALRDLDRYLKGKA